MSERAEIIAGLREFADWLDAHPDAASPVVIAFNAFVESAAELSTMARVMAPCEKGESDVWFYVRRTWGPITFDVNIARSQVCERRVVGTRVVPPTPERVEEIIEWECAPSLLALSPGEART